MALSSSALSALIVSNWKADPKTGFSSPLTPAQDEIIKALADGVASAVIDHFKSNGQVLVTGVYPGGATAPGTIS